MYERVMQKWVKALRSGKYNQGRGALCQVEKDGTKNFCCLGVLCDLYNKERRLKKKKTMKVEKCDPSSLGITSSKSEYLYAYNSQESHLPNEVVKWAGITYGNCCGEFSNLGSESLMTLNDGCEILKVRKHNFEKIADIIEENYELL